MKFDYGGYDDLNDYEYDIEREDYLRRKRERDRITEYEQSGYWSEPTEMED